MRTPLVACVCIVLLGFNANSQLVFPPFYPAGQKPAYGQEISDTLTNLGTAPATFYFNYLIKDSLGNIEEDKKTLFLSDSAFAWYLFSKHSALTNADDRLVAYVTELARFYKNNRNFHNNLNITQPNQVLSYDSGYAKLTAVNGMHATAHHMQCGDYARLAMTTLYEIYSRGWDTAACQPWRYRLDDITGTHNIFEIWHNQKWAFVDIDPGTPGFMFADTINGGYYSLTDIMANPNLVSANWWFRYDDMTTAFFPLSDSLLDNIYRSYFTGGLFTLGDTWAKFLLYNSKSNSIPGQVTLPPGGSLVFHHKVNTLDMDISQPQEQAIVQTGFNLSTAYGQTGNQQYLDSLHQLLVNTTGLDSAAITCIMQNNLFNIYYGNWKAFDVEPENGFTPNRLEYLIPQRTNTLQIGTDIGGPFIVANCKLAGKALLGDTLVTDTFSNMLWTASNTGGHINYPEQLIQYFTSGFILPQNATTSIKCYYNTGYIDWWNGYSINELGVNDTLVLKRSSDPSIVNNISAPTPNPLTDWKFYPNPATESITIQHPDNDKVSLVAITGIDGRNYTSQADANGKVIVKDLAPGIYVLSIGVSMMPKIFVKQ